MDVPSLYNVVSCSKSKRGVPKKKNIKRKFAMSLGRKKCRKTQSRPLTTPSILITLISEEEGYDDVFSLAAQLWMLFTTHITAAAALTKGAYQFF